MAAGDLTTLANVKTWVNLSGSTDDALLTRLITAVSNLINSWLNRQLTSAVYSEYYDGTGGERLVTTNYPVTAVSSVVIDGVSIPVSTGPLVPGYTFDATSIILRGGYKFNQGAAPGAMNVQIGYTAGYVTMPVEIEQACIELVALRYAERLRPGVTSRSIGGENVAYIDKGMTDSVSALLLQYKKVAPS